MKIKITTRILACAAVVAGLAAQDASAVLFTNEVLNTQGMGVRARSFNTTSVTYDQTYDKAYTRSYGDPDPDNSTGHDVGKAYLQFDLSNTWALYGQSNLVSASIWLWGENGTGRDFDMYSLKDSAGLENWDMNTLLWTNAPANNTNSGYKFETNMCFGDGPIWVFRENAIDVSRPDLGGNYDQDALYISPADNTNFLGVLQADTDGLVTFMWGGYNNQNWWVGTNGTYLSGPSRTSGTDYPIYSTDGQYYSAQSPTLVMVFDVRVALTGGGALCPGDPGADISLAGTDTGNDYLLYTNGVYAGQTVSGNGTNVSFGLESTVATYTCVESNTTTSATRLLPGTPVIYYYGAPSISVEPASFTAATNSVAFFTLAATNSGGGLSYQWYHNGAPLSDDGHYIGTTNEQLIIDPVLASDAATAADGYYCVVSTPCGDTATSMTNALTVQTARDLKWVGTPSNTWDIATTPNWYNSGSSSADVFDQGDNVTLDDTAADTTVLASSPYLSPGTITFNASGTMTIDNTGNGDISGPNTSLIVNGPTLSSQLVINNANSFGGGTTINDGWLTVNDNKSVGTGTITMAGTGFSLLEVVAGGGANEGVPGINVTEDCKVQFDHSGSYAGAILGPLTGTAGKTLSIVKSGGNSGDNIRLWDNSFSCDANIVLDIGTANLAPYNSGGYQIYNGVISGTGVIFTRVFGGGQLILNGANTYDGGTRLSAGAIGVGIDSAGVDSGVTSGAFGTGLTTVEGDVDLFASGGDHTLGNSFAYTGSGGSFTFTGTNVLTLNGSIDLGGGVTSPVDRTISADAGTEGVISGAINDNTTSGCGLIKSGGGSLYLDGANTYTGTTTVSDGVLAGSGSIAGSLDVTGGAIGGGSAAAIGTLTVNGNVTLNGGGVFVRVDKGQSPANDAVSVTGTLSNSGSGTITVTNLGSALQTGDSFTLFSKPVTGGATLTVTGAGMTWTNKLATDGSIEVVGTAVNPNPTNITFTVSNGTLNLEWPADHTGWSLQAQTNNLATGLSTNWTTLGYENTNKVSISVDPADPAVFYRLVYQP